jgi:hypothetical protein
MLLVNDLFPLISHPINITLPEVDINWSSTVSQYMSIMILICFGPKHYPLDAFEIALLYNIFPKLRLLD